MLLTVTYSAFLTRPRVRHGHRLKLRPVVTYEADLHVDLAYSAGSPGRFGGLPESCYPDEPDQIEVLGACIAETGRVVHWTPTDAQMMELEELAREEVGEEASDDFERECRSDW